MQGLKKVFSVAVLSITLPGHRHVNYPAHCQNHNQNQNYWPSVRLPNRKLDSGYPRVSLLRLKRIIKQKNKWARSPKVTLEKGQEEILILHNQFSHCDNWRPWPGRGNMRCWEKCSRGGEMMMSTGWRSQCATPPFMLSFHHRPAQTQRSGSPSSAIRAWSRPSSTSIRSSPILTSGATL